MISALFAAAILLAETTPAAAPAVAPPAVTDGKPAVVMVRRNDDMICKSEMVLGTRIPKKVCYTRAEQEARTQQDRSNLDHMQSSFGKISN